ncbi:MAG: 4Fe-4S dicluster domain-containing protein [Chloroflexi bacterium]|nr:4Fe-4S dicluster domain-containing protein [Chloroflexota bacterium]MCL5075187.1 4Fe-4S dicluster domain-containing protein [Chloroflexota bacterium]
MNLQTFELEREMLDHHFAETVTPDREKLLTCIQCGTCTASCPTAYAMDYTPRQLWRLIQVGMREAVLNSTTFWLCTSCYSCTIRCPRGIALTETMSSLKRLAMAEGIRGRERIARFYKAFVETIRRHGRMHEVEFIAIYLGRKDPFSLLERAPLGLALWRKGKLSLIPIEMKRKNDLAILFRKVAELEGQK